MTTINPLADALDILANDFADLGYHTLRDEVRAVGQNYQVIQQQMERINSNLDELDKLLNMAKRRRRRRVALPRQMATIHEVEAV
ncbi:hypothetical protein DICA3_F29272 [Diutina catenulata]